MNYSEGKEDQIRYVIQLAVMDLVSVLTRKMTRMSKAKTQISDLSRAKHDTTSWYTYTYLIANVF